jgi:ATP-binding cassette subfamily B protein RaxB
VPIAEASKHFTGVVLELEPKLQFKRKKEALPIDLVGILGNVKGLRQSIVHVLLLALVLEVFLLLGPMLSQWIIDDALVSYDRDLLTLIVVGMTLLGLMHALVNLIRARTLMYLGTSLNIQWVANVVAHLFKLPLSYFEKRTVGDIQTRFGAIATIGRILTTSFAAAILDGIMAITTLVMMLVYSTSLAAICLGAVVLYGALREFRLSALRSAALGQLIRLGTQQSLFLESLRGMQAIKLFNRESTRLSRYMKVAVETANCDVDIQKVGQFFEAANGVLVAVETGLILWLGGHAVLRGELTIGMLLAFIAYKAQFSSRIVGLIDKTVELRMLRMHAERLADIVLSEPEPEVDKPYLAAATIVPSLELRRVSYRYGHGEPWVIADFSMKVEPGEAVVLVGPSGAGKTTLLKILLGQLTPQQGQVRIGDVKLSQIGLSGYRDMIGVVMQTDCLLSGSLAENIAFFDEKIDLAWMELCARVAHIHDEIVRMPMGYNSLVGDMGTTLSGGQKQRILLARALYKRPKILLLDEATSHLDPVLETHIGAAIARLNITRIVIAHRQETIRASGRVIHVGRPAAPRPPVSAVA